jgi:hypothetical protein
VADAFVYDVFLCYAPQARATAETLVDRLTAAGLNVWWEGREVRRREQGRAAKVARGLEQSRTLVLLWSKSASGRAWPKLERQTSYFRRPSDASRRFVPVRLDETPAPAALEALVFVEWRDGGNLAQLKALCMPSGGTADTSVATLRGHTGDVNCLAVAPDGRLALSASNDNTVRQWDLHASTPLATLEGHTERVYHVARAQAETGDLKAGLES